MKIESGYVHVSASGRAWRTVGRAVLIWCVLVGAALLLFSQYYLFVSSAIVVNFIAITGLVILTGHSGQISLGHGAFVGFGAYVCAIAMEKLGLPYWLSVPLAGIASFFIGYLFGYPALRLEGLYLALATFALGLTFPQVIKFKWVQPVTGGYMGLLLSRPQSPLPGILSVDEWLFLFIAFWGLVSYLIAVGISDSRLSLAWRALRDHRVAAEVNGVDRLSSNNAAFGVCAMYAGISGALGVVLTQFVAADTFSIFLSFTLLVGAVVGGVHSLLGAMFGAIFIQFIPNLADSISKAAPWAVYGGVLLAVIAVAPNGIAGVLTTLFARIARAAVEVGYGKGR
ncbi:MAG: branched-chain amino acid ABC transporter permease [Chloroflexota bacterium]